MNDGRYVGELRIVKRIHPSFSKLVGIVWFDGVNDLPMAEMVFEQWDGDVWCQLTPFDPGNKPK